MRDIQKEYYGNPVLKGVSLKVMPGEIHALCGENGAGKSTLMNILFGMPVIHETGGFSGTLELMGSPVAVRGPADAMKLGIGMVHQEFMLIPGFTIAENIKLGREPLRTGLLGRMLGEKLHPLDTGKMSTDARGALDRLGLSVSEELPVAGLPVGYMQFIEIAREIDKENLRLLVFDEPTAVLTEDEAKSLLSAMKRLAAQGVGILFISHRLDEVIDVSDKITILRDGAAIETIERQNATAELIAERMVGRKIDLKQKQGGFAGREGEQVLVLKNFTVKMPGERVRGVDLEVRRGEILGLGGLAGQGKIGIANGLMGLYPADGEVIVEGHPLPLGDAAASIAARLSFVSEDRRGVGLLPDTAIERNMVLPAIVNQKRFLRGAGAFTQLDSRAIRRTANELIEQLDIRCTGPSQPVRRLSGGNQQKVCIARALLLGPQILLISEPTRGIDVGAKSLVLDTLVRLNREEGLTVVMTSSELAELRLICDRIAIITDGKVARILSPDASDAAFGLAMAGSKGTGGAI